MIRHLETGLLVNIAIEIIEKKTLRQLVDKSMLCNLYVIIDKQQR